MNLSDRELAALVYHHASNIQTETYASNHPQFIDAEGDVKFKDVSWKAIAEAADRISQIAMSKVQGK